MLRIFDEFVKENLIEYSPTETVVLLNQLPHWNVEAGPNIYLGDVILAYVDKFKYLGQIITHDLKNDQDNDRERRNIAVRGDVLIHKFNNVQMKLNVEFFVATAIT